MNLLTCFHIFITACTAALILVPRLRRLAINHGTLDRPDHRKVHAVPTPRLGGVAIFAAFLLAAVVFVPIEATVRGVLAGLLVIFVTGLADDLLDVPARTKFAGQIAACLLTVMISGLWLRNLGDLFGLGTILLPPWIGIPFTVFAVVGVINAVNLIDGLDGLAGGTSVIALAAFFVLAWLSDDATAMLLTAALAGALMGFLKYNTYPAKIFMGDTGSLTIGFLLGFLAVHLTQQAGGTVSPMAPVIVLGTPLIDAVWVMGRRLLEGTSPFAADRGHVHHKFLDLGFEHRFTVIVIYGLSIFWAACAVVGRQAPESLLLAFFLATAALFYLALRYVTRHRERFAFLARDDESGLRTTATYQRIAETFAQLSPCVALLLAAYLLLAFAETINGALVSWQVALPLLMIGAVLWVRKSASSREYLVLILYAVAGLATFALWHADAPLFGGLSLKRAGDALLGTAGLIALLRIQFRRRVLPRGSEPFLLSPLDMLTVGLCLFLAVATHQELLPSNVNGVFLRTILAVFSLRVMVGLHPGLLRPAGLVGLLYLALLTLLGLAG